jgi:hypothetical protein
MDLRLATAASLKEARETPIATWRSSSSKDEVKE